MQTAPDITRLLETVQKQNEEIALLKKQIAELEARLLRYEHPKNSSNRSTPPLQDLFCIKRTESLREKSGKKPGGHLEQRLDELLQRKLDPKQEKLITFQNRLTHYRQHLFRFLYRYDVSPDNNASERAVRTFKVKQKVSGLFRSMNGATAFAIIRSVIDTAIKNSQNVWGALNSVATIAE
jgi:hypothetical protein